MTQPVPPEPDALQLGELIAQEDTAQAVEAERRRLAELLNSRIVNPLHLLLAQAGAYEQSLGSSPQVGMVVSVLASLARQVLQQALDLQAALNPTLLEVLGLEAALDALAQQKIRVHGVQISLKLDRLRERLPAPLELVIFRAAQDGLDHAIQRGYASRLTLTLACDDDRVSFSIEDNGSSRALLRDTERRVTQLDGTIERLANALHLRFRLTPPVDLTTRELEVLVLLAEGLANKEIAQRLQLSARTVNFHLDNIYSKLSVNSRTEAVVYALRNGLVQVPPR
jgi:DNA-binding CsgD family transcriptional regulator